MMQGFTVRIADTVTRVEWEWEGLTVRLNEAERKFLCEDCDLDLLMQVEVGELPRLEVTRQLFSCDTWRLHETPEGRLLALVSRRTGMEPYRLIALDRDGSRATLYVQEDLATRGGPADPPGTLVPFEHPSMELITYWRLAQEGGLGLHAAGVVTDGAGVLFSGVSGAGKSTISELWMGEGATVLSDDRIGIRPDGDGYRMYGTPWHGTLRVCDPGTAPARAIFFIEHGQSNEAEPMDEATACATLIARAFPPYFSAEDMSLALEAAARIVAAVPCYVMRFVPDASAPAFVRQVLEQVRDDGA